MTEHKISFMLSSEQERVVRKLAKYDGLSIQAELIALLVSHINEVMELQERGNES